MAPVPIEVVAIAGVVALVGTVTLWAVRWWVYRGDEDGWP
jgi:hypothetical protein